MAEVAEKFRFMPFMPLMPKQKIECDRLTVWKQKRSNGKNGQGEYSIKMTHDKENYKITGLYYV